MLRFRTGNHKLPVEVGRWNNIELAERKCQLCQTSNIDDELYYTLECSFFRTERQTLISQYYYKCPNMLKFKELLTTENESKLIKLAKFMKIVIMCFA